ncbi:LysR family transcriptional regulator [Paenibacillus sp. GXUN7292]|uniref:LysR family transcriptional regulator n=1 Tax=Paenibacillus sp. GXUN7292 TaxID=3422499 RepID=UPI003D7E77C1
MNLHHLYVFCTVAELRSFAQAASEINISQPAVSQHISNLEAAMGKKLIERKGRAFSLTQHGETLFDYGKRIFNMVEEAEQALMRVGRHQEKIFIGVTNLTGTYYLPDIISTFIENNPHTSFNAVFEDNNSELIEKLIKNQLDIIITYESVVLRDEIQVLPVVQDEIVLVLPGNHPWAAKQLISFEEAITLPFIFHSPEVFVQPIMENILTGHNINVILQLGYIESVKSAIIRGLGVSMLPYSSIRFELEAGLLSVANCPVFRVPRNLVLMRKRSSIETDLILKFKDYLLSNEWSI